MMGMMVLIGVAYTIVAASLAAQDGSFPIIHLWFLGMAVFVVAGAILRKARVSRHW